MDLESEGETSSQGWSGHGWRPSISSEAASPISSRPSRSDRQAQHTAPLDTSLRNFHANPSDSPAELTPIPISNGYSSPPTYNGVGISSSGSYPQPNAARARRKSLANPTHQLHRESAQNTSEEEDVYPGTGNGGVGHTKSKAKRDKRGREGSFTYLPFHRRRRLSNPSESWLSLSWLKQSISPKRSKRSYLLLLLLILSLLYGIGTWLKTYQIQVEFSIFSRQWIKDEIDTILPLKGCFNPNQISPTYNLTTHNSPKKQLLSPGISLRRGMSCYDFSSTVQPIPNEPLSNLTYHTYWRSDLIPFGPRQSATLTAFLATQPLEYSKLIVWTNSAESISSNPLVVPFLDQWGEYISIRQVDLTDLSTGLEIHDLMRSAQSKGLFDEKAWVDGDAVRLLVLWHFGGVWLDMDMILTRDLHPLTEQEFVTQWDCYDKPYFSLNGAIMHFLPQSPYLCEAFHIMATSPLPSPNTFTWGSHLYSKLHRRLLASHIKPFTVLPWCFVDPRNCRMDVRFPDPFLPDPEYWGGRPWSGAGDGKGGGKGRGEDGGGEGRSGRELLEEKVGHVWALHLHNQWGKNFPPGGWVERLLEGYEAKVEEIERWSRSLHPDQRGRVRVKRCTSIGDEEAVEDAVGGAGDNE